MLNKYDIKLAKGFQERFYEGFPPGKFIKEMIELTGMETEFTKLDKLSTTTREKFKIHPDYHTKI